MQAPASSPTPPADFCFYTSAQVFENLAKSEQKRHMRIGGPIGSECEDLAKEVVLQDGLNYDDFLGLRGFFNKNHSADTLDILGAPESVKLYKTGELMPNGHKATHATTWVEGFLYDTQKGRETYELAKAMQGSGRSLGFSIEGRVEERSGPGNRTIAKARIQNVAITHVPCNPDARLEVLLRSVSNVNQLGQSFHKTFTIGHGALAQASDGYDVPLVDAKDPEGKAEGKDKPSGLPWTREELDRHIVSVVHPLLLEAITGGVSKSLRTLADNHRDARRRSHQAKTLMKARARACRHINRMRASASLEMAKAHVPPAAAPVPEANPPTDGQIFQTIYRSMPGISASYAERLAANIRRNSSRS